MSSVVVTISTITVFVHATEEGVVTLRVEGGEDRFGGKFDDVDEPGVVVRVDVNSHVEQRGPAVQQQLCNKTFSE